MDFEVYCDESGLEALTNKTAHTFTAIGGIWLPSDCRSEFKQAMHSIKDRHSIAGELKWQKLSPAYFELYKEVMDYFFSVDYIRFRVILIEASKVDNIRFNNEDAELGFYKFYYQLLHHWIYDFNSYDIFLDLKVNRNKGRLKELEKVLNNANITSEIAFYESANHKAKDKSVLSLNRCEKMLWIKETLQDPSALLKKGWDSKTKSYDDTRRVAMVKGNYVVIVLIHAAKKARFIMAFQIDDDENLELFKNGPDWT